MGKIPTLQHIDVLEGSLNSKRLRIPIIARDFLFQQKMFLKIDCDFENLLDRESF